MRARLVCVERLVRVTVARTRAFLGKLLPETRSESTSPCQVVEAWRKAESGAEAAPAGRRSTRASEMTRNHRAGNVYTASTSITP